MTTQQQKESGPNEREFRVFGPPKSGTGKTSHLVRQIDHAVQAHGIGKVLVASFTKTAAAEICERAGIKGHQYAGTLHALCYRQLNQPDVAEKKIGDWNTHCKAHGTPWLQLSDATVDFDESAVQQADGSQGDEAYRTCGILRARMIDRALWPQAARAFDDKWRAWKDEANVNDFTDMIERSLRGSFDVPGNATIGFFDEVQDFTKLELTLVRKWAAQMETVILAGDDDQCLYNFKGASPDAFLNPPVPDSQKRILSQSYRVPVAVHAFAQRWIERVKTREPKIYRPRCDDIGLPISGSLDRMDSASSKFPDPIIKDVEKQIALGKSSMILASCSFHLHATVKALRAAGIPFHNPYRTKRGDWNPLLRGSSKRTTALDRVLAFLTMRGDAEDLRTYTHKELDSWIDVLRSEFLRRGAKTEIETLAAQEPHRRTEWPYLNELFKDGGAGFQQALVANDLRWFQASLLAAKAKAHEYACEVYRRHGYEAIYNRPLVTVGTIHSVKGGEADNVYLYPDLSAGAQREHASDPDPTQRMFYVAFTRARERLVLCSPASAGAVEWR